MTLFRSCIILQIQNRKAAHTVQNGLAIYIQMHKVYVPTEMQNTKGVHSIYIEKGGMHCIYKAGEMHFGGCSIIEYTE